MSKALLDFLAAEDDGDDDAAVDANDDAGDGVALGEVDISTGGGASLAGLEQQLDRLSDHPVLRAILDQVCCGQLERRCSGEDHGQGLGQLSLTASFLSLQLHSPAAWR